MPVTWNFYAEISRDAHYRNSDECRAKAVIVHGLLTKYGEPGVDEPDKQRMINELYIAEVKKLDTINIAALGITEATGLTGQAQTGELALSKSGV
jgi:hypothetical protein